MTDCVLAPSRLFQQRESASFPGSEEVPDRHTELGREGLRMCL